MKQCSACLEEKPEDQFYNKSGYPGKKVATCKKCWNARTKRWKDANPERRKQQCRDSKKRLHTQNYYNLPPEKYQKMVDAQGGVCKICFSPNVDGKNLAVDHDHKCCPARRSCGKCIRALLCNPCNYGLAGFKDDVDILKRAIEYIEEWS